MKILSRDSVGSRFPGNVSRGNPEGGNARFAVRSLGLERGAILNLNIILT